MPKMCGSIKFWHEDRVGVVHYFGRVRSAIEGDQGRADRRNEEVIVGGCRIILKRSHLWVSLFSISHPAISNKNLW